MTWAAFSCVHVPHHHPVFVDWMLRVLEENRPDVVVNLGDFLVADAASKFPSEEQHDLAYEYEEADKLLRLVRETAGERHVYLEGNHEANIGEWGRLDPRVRSLCDWRVRIDDVQHWKVVPYINGPEGVYRLGQVAFCHGHECGPSSDRFQAQRFAPEWGLFVSGHTHRPLQVQRVPFVGKRMLNKAMANAGTLADASKMRYTVRRDTSTWGAGVVLGVAQETKSPRAKPHWLAELVRPGMPMVDYLSGMLEELESDRPLGPMDCHPVLPPEPGEW